MGVFLFFLFLFLVLQSGKAQKPKKVVEIEKHDLPYIACDVCQHAVAEIFAILDIKKQEKKKVKMDELEIMEVLNAICKAEDEASGSWIKMLDIVETKKSEAGKTTLSLVAPGGSQKCGKECATIAASCESLLQDEIDLDSLSAALWKDAKLSTVVTNVCTKESKRCAKPSKPIKHKRTDEDFKPMTKKEQEMEELMRTMKSSGLGGGMSMYDRDDMDAMMKGGMGGMGGMDGYGDEDGYGDGMYGGDGEAPPASSSSGRGAREESDVEF